MGSFFAITMLARPSKAWQTTAFFPSS
jgi:hypothetical protein